MNEATEVMRLSKAQEQRHPREMERRRIIAWLLAAEFGGRSVKDRPQTEPARWAEVLGETIDAPILERAAAAWETGAERYDFGRPTYKKLF